MTKENTLKPKPRTLKRAEKDLHDKESSKTSKSTGGFVVRAAKGIKEKSTKRKLRKRNK